MANEELIASVKTIVSLLKSGKTDEAYHGYAELFESSAFGGYRPEDQRQALKLMILANKNVPTNPDASFAAAHKSALGRLEALVAAAAEPIDYEMLGVCQQVLGDDAAAAESYKAGLTIERERDPQSDLCGALMRRVASV